MEKQSLNYLFGSVVILAIWIIAYIITTEIEDLQRDNIEQQLLQTQKSFKIAQKLRYDRLVESAYLLAENSTFKANLELADPATLKYSVNDFSRFMKIDLFTVVDENGIVLAAMGQDVESGENISNQPSIKNALQGKEPKNSIEWPELQQMNGSLYHIVSIPVYAGRQSIIGAIKLGAKFTNTEIQELRQDYNFNVHFIHEEKILGSSKDNKAEQDFYLSYFKKYFDSTSINLDVGNYFTFTNGATGSKRLIGFISPMGMGENAYFMCSIDEDQVLNYSSTFAFYTYIFAALLTIGVGLICYRSESPNSDKK